MMKTRANSRQESARRLPVASSGILFEALPNWRNNSSQRRLSAFAAIIDHDPDLRAALLQP